MSHESADAQLKQLLTKALDDAWNAGIEKGKVEGRRAGIEEAYKIASEQSLLALRMKLEEALEAK